MTVCPQCGQENPDIAKCLNCGTALASSSPQEEVRKLITVLFTDIVDSTATAEQLDPENVRARLQPYYTRLRAELERFGGSVEKFIGDAVVAIFGAPVAHEDDPERAVRAALAICDAIDDLNEADEWLDLKVRIGVHTGEALIVLGARTAEGEGMASGDVMNTAARIQSAAPVSGILVGEETYRATRSAIDFRRAEPIGAKGKSRPVPVWEVVGVRGQEPEHSAAAAAFVGRDSELEQLLAAWEAVRRDRVTRLVGVRGAAGMGKTRLLAELGRRVQEDGRVHWGRCLSYGEGITYWPISELVKSAAGILQSDPRETLAAKLEVFIDGLPTHDRDELRTIAAALSNVIGIPTTPRGTHAAAEIAQAELHWGIRRAAQLLTRQRPTVLVLEDLHWAEPTLLELIEYIVSDRSEAPLLLIVTARPDIAETDPAFAERVGGQWIDLEVLPAAASAELLRGLVGDTSLAQTELAGKLIENAGGNPLFLEETVRMLQDEGLLDGPTSDLPYGEQTLPLPTSLQTLVSSRLDRLAQTERRLTHEASVVGSVFWAGAVAYLGATDGERPDPRPGLHKLVRQDFIHRNEQSSVANEEEYAFKHILIRDVAYSQVPKGRRAQLHLRFADWVMLLPSGDEFVEIVAWHLEQACRLSSEVVRSPIEPPLLDAAGALSHAARRAEQREGLREAHRYYTRALEVLCGQHQVPQAELRLRRAEIMMMLGHLREACQELLEVADSAAALERPAVECEARVLLGDIDQRQGRPSEARRQLNEARRLAAKVGDRRLQVKVAFVSASVRYDFEGDFQTAIEDLRNAIAIANEMEDHELLTDGHLYLAAMLMNLGRYQEAEEALNRCLTLAGQMGSLKIEAEATAWLGGVKYYRGEQEEGKRLGLQAREWLERTGDSYFFAQNLVTLAAHALLEGDPARAEVELRNALPVALEIGGWIVVETYRYLAEALVEQGRLDQARELVSLAERNLPEADSYARSALLRAQATVSAATGERASSATAFEEALRLLEGLHLPVELAETRIDSARALRSLGDVSGAQNAYQLARSACVRMGLRPLVEQIDRELAETA